MNPDQLKQAINFDYQLMTFALGMHQYFITVDEKATQLSGELIAFAQKFGDFVQQERKSGLVAATVKAIDECR